MLKKSCHYEPNLSVLMESISISCMYVCTMYIELLNCQLNGSKDNQLRFAVHNFWWHLLVFSWPSTNTVFHLPHSHTKALVLILTKLFIVQRRCWPHNIFQNESSRRKSSKSNEGECWNITNYILIKVGVLPN